MGLFRSKTDQSQNLFSEPQTTSYESRTGNFQGTLSDIKASPKADISKPDSRLESLSRKTFF